jgi:hypothetical protein
MTTNRGERRHHEKCLKAFCGGVMNQEHAVGPVVHLSTFRLARRAADALAGLLHSPPWLVRVGVEVDDAGGLAILVLVTKTAPHVARALPRSFDDFPVLSRVATARRAAP